MSGEDDEVSSWLDNQTRQRGRPRRESSDESEPAKAVKATSIPDEHHAKLLVIVSASDGSKPLSPANPIKMATLIKKRIQET